MSSALPIHDASLARGYVQRTLREAVLHQAEGLRRADAAFAPTRQRRGPLFRAWVGYLDTALGPRVLTREVAGSGKEAAAQWVYWEALGEDAPLGVCIAWLDGRSLRIREVQIARVSRHALQRLFQRLRTTDATAALRELLPALELAAELFAKAQRHGERYQTHLDVPTAQGEAVLVWDGALGRFLVKTWIERAGLNTRRGARWEAATRAGDRLCV